MLHDLIIAVGGIILLMAGWILFQNWVRKNSPELPPDCDVLEGRFGCSTCALADHCQKRIR